MSDVVSVLEDMTRLGMGRAVVHHTVQWETLAKVFDAPFRLAKPAILRWTTRGLLGGPLQPDRTPKQESRSLLPWGTGQQTCRRSSVGNRRVNLGFTCQPLLASDVPSKVQTVTQHSSRSGYSRYHDLVNWSYQSCTDAFMCNEHVHDQ